MRETRRFGGMGASSVLMIFVVLCLTTFGILSLVSAQADLRLTRKSQETVSAYYTADARTEALIAALDTALLEACGQAVTQEEYTARIDALLADIAEAALQDDGTVLLTVPVQDRLLYTVVEITPLTAPVRYRIVSRRVETADGEVLDDGETWNLWSGH